MGAITIDDVTGKPIPPDPGIKRIPVRIDRNTVILVAEGDDIQAHVERFKNRKYDCPGTAPWW